MIFNSIRQRQAESGRQDVLTCANRLSPGDEESRLLDIGCGDGNLSCEFANRIGVAHIYGVDAYEPAIEKAQGRGIIVKKTDLNQDRLPFPDDFFDYILCHQVAEHLQNPDNLFQEIRRTLKTNGQCVLSVPNLCSLHNRIFVMMGWHPTVISPSNKCSFGNPTRGELHDTIDLHRHHTAFSPSALREMFKYYGLNVDKCLGSGLHPFNNILSKPLLKLFPGWGVIQIAVVSKNA